MPLNAATVFNGFNDLNGVQRGSHRWGGPECTDLFIQSCRPYTYIHTPYIYNPEQNKLPRVCLPPCESTTPAAPLHHHPSAAAAATLTTRARGARARRSSRRTPAARHLSRRSRLTIYFRVSLMPGAARGGVARRGGGRGALASSRLREQRARPPVGCTALPCCLFSVFDESSRLSSPSPLFVVNTLLSHHSISLNSQVLGDM